MLLDGTTSLKYFLRLELITIFVQGLVSLQAEGKRGIGVQTSIWQLFKKRRMTTAAQTYLHP